MHSSVQATRARLHTQQSQQHPTPRCVSYSRVLLPEDEEQLLAWGLDRESPKRAPVSRSWQRRFLTLRARASIYVLFTAVRRSRLL